MDFRYARPPPPPPPSSDPHQRPPQQPVPPPPGTWYSGQFQYHSPSPPPPQWAQQPQHPDHHLPPPYAVAPPPPMPYSSNPYPLPPRPHMPLPPPQPHYPPVNQEWSNTNWGHQGWDHSAHNKNEDDWAARARAWAASKTVTDDQHQHQHPQLNPATRPEETNYQGQYTQNLDPPYTEFQQHPLPPSNYQQYPSSFPPPPRTPANNLQEPSSFTSGYASDGNFSYTARDGNLRDPAAAFPHQEPAPTSLSAHQQEVPSSYSSVAGKEDSRETNGKFYQPSHLPFASAPQHQIPPPISPRDRLISIEQPHYSFSNPSIDPTTDLSNQPLDFGPRFSHDHDPTGAISTGMHLTPSFGRSSFQPTMASGNATFPIGASNAFHVTSGFPIDTYGTPGFPERNKKVSVPNWLREEIIKKKAVIGTEISRQDTESNEDEVMEGSLGKGDQVDGKSMSTEEEDDVEDYVEAARTAAINQEIKRILTEVLLKVTDELFDEIATKVLEEDELSVEVEHKPIASSDMPPAIPTPKSSSAKVLLIPAKTKGTDADDSRNSNSSSPGDVLGLGNYASDDDDDDEEKEVQNPSSINSKPTENGSSHVDGSKFLEKESDSHGVSPNGKSSSQTDADHVTQEHRNHDSGGDEKVSDDKHELFIDGISDKNLLPNDSQGKNTDKRKLEAKLTLSSTATLNDGRKIPLIGLGVYQAPKGDTTQNAVTWALEAGYRHIDTAALYKNEADVGIAVNKSGIPREEIWITTKIWDSDQGYEKTLQAAERSLEKLQSEYIDLLILHSPLRGSQLRKESYDALQQLVRLGKVKSIGVSNYSVKHLKELLEQKPEIKPTVNQVEIHPWLTRNDITTFCLQNDIVVEAYSPLTKGKKLKDPTLVQIAERYNKSSAQILIRWGLQHGFVTLPKSINKDRIIQNTDVYDFEIREEDMKILDDLDEYLTTGWDPTTCE